MKEKLQIVAFFILLQSIHRELFSQNLIANGGFEITSSMPVVIGDVSMLSNWSSPTTATPDYFNSNALVPDAKVPDNYFGSQQPHGGNGYCGIIIFTISPFSVGYEYREYMQQEMNAPLHQGTVYNFEFYISRAGGFTQRLATDKMGFYFSNIKFNLATGLHLPVKPDFESPVVVTDSDNWTKISGCYTAVSDDIKYVIIGCFEDNAGCNVVPILPLLTGTVNRAYYYIDDVSLTEMKVDFDFDTLNCSSTIAFSNHSTGALNFSWNFDDGTSDNSENPEHRFSFSGTYHVTLTATTADGCSFSITKKIEVKNENHFVYIPSAFTPNDDGLNDIFEIHQTEFCKPLHCTIFNRWGEIIFDDSSYTIRWDGTFKNKKVQEGIYFYVVESGDKKYSGGVAVIR